MSLSSDSSCIVSLEKYLEKKGYQSVWGVGRHILGSQIFDYWYQPEGKFMIEHYAGASSITALHYMMHGFQSCFCGD